VLLSGTHQENKLGHIENHKGQKKRNKTYGVLMVVYIYKKKKKKKKKRFFLFFLFGGQIISFWWDLLRDDKNDE
jgi:hypothetical protein